MVAISFSVFKDKILTGKKTQTIRPYSERRYNQIKKKGILQLYWKQRTKESELLKEVKLESIDIIRLYAPIHSTYFDSKGYKVGYIHIWNGDRWEKTDDRDMILTVKRDGFETVEEMYRWFYDRYGEKVYNIVFMRIRWGYDQNEFVEDEIRKLRKDAEFLIKYIDEGKDVGLILSKAWDIELRRRIIKGMI